jgi:hypothetical protein
VSIVSVMRVKFTLLLVFVAAVLAGCNGGTGNSTAIPPHSQSVSSVQSLTKQTSNGNVTFAIGITPRSKALGTRATPQYVSVSTESLTILTDRGNPVTVNLTPSSPNCSPNPSSPGSYICTARLNVPSGNHIFTLTAYDRTGGAGNVLSRNSTGTVYVKPTGATTVSIVLQGVVQYVTLKLATTNPAVGGASAIGLTAVLEDADHNLIVGPARFDNPVTLTTTDSTDGPLSKSILNSPADAAGVTANYNGGQVASITYSATATGLSTANVTNAVLEPVPFYSVSGLTLSADSPSQFVAAETTLTVPAEPPPTGTLFLWPGLQPFGANFFPIDNGVLQTVLTWGPSCAPGFAPELWSTWWVSAQYVNTFGSDPGYTGCLGGPIMAVNVGDSLAIKMSLTNLIWTQTVKDLQTGKAVSFAINMQNQAQNFLYFFIEGYSQNPVSSVVFSDTSVTFSSVPVNSCTLTTKEFVEARDSFTRPIVTDGGLKCAIKKITMFSPGGPVPVSTAGIRPIGSPPISGRVGPRIVPEKP